jgi:hypothetical protein
MSSGMYPLENADWSDLCAEADEPVQKNSGG